MQILHGAGNQLRLIGVSLGLPGVSKSDSQGREESTLLAIPSSG